MKKFLILALAAVLMILAVSCGSGSSGEKAEGDLPDIKTLGDIFELETEDYSDIFDDKVFGCAFRYDGRTIRAIADMPEGLYEKLDTLDMSDYEKFEADRKELLSSVEVKQVEDITDTILTDEELEALKGKTGKELIDDGFEFKYYSGDNQFGMEKGFIQYTVTVDGEVDEDKAEDEKVIYDLKVTDVQNSGFSEKIQEAE